MHGRRRVGMILEECLNVMSDLLKDNGDGKGLERDEYRELEVYGREDAGTAEEGFGAYGLRDELARALEKKGFETPTPVQCRVLESDWRGRDLIVRARTGSGKTLAFLLPLLQDMRVSERSPHLLVLAPTRELAQQTAREAEWLVRYLDVSVVSFVEG